MCGSNERKKGESVLSVQAQARFTNVGYDGVGGLKYIKRQNDEVVVLFFLQLVARSLGAAATAPSLPLVNRRTFFLMYFFSSSAMVSPLFSSLCIHLTPTYCTHARTRDGIALPRDEEEVDRLCSHYKLQLTFFFAEVNFHLLPHTPVFCPLSISTRACCCMIR